MVKRQGVLELAVLGLLHQGPLHGYALRKRLNAMLGTFRALSYGSLYPALKDLSARGWIAEDGPIPVPAGAHAMSGRRARIVYKLTAEGKEHLQLLLAEAGPSAWEDEGFGVHFALFAQTDAEVRCASWRGAAADLRNGARASVRPWLAPVSGWTATPSNSIGTGSNRSSARSVG